MRIRRRKRIGRNQPANSRNESGQAMSEYIIVSIGLVLALVAAVKAVDVLLQHHERASAAMQIPL